MTKDPRMPGPLLAAGSVTGLPIFAVIGWTEAPSQEATRRIVERVNQAWFNAWDDELRSHPINRSEE